MERTSRQGAHAVRARWRFGVAGAAALTFSASAGAQSYVPGGEILDETWTNEFDPYYVGGDLVVPEGGILTIQPGTQVIIAQDDSLHGGLDTQRIEITVRGELYVNGTLSKPVVISNMYDETLDSWYGIVVEPEATLVRLQFAHISNGHSAVEALAPAANLEVIASTFSKCEKGLVIHGNVLRLDRILAEGCEQGFWLEDAPSVTLTNFVARGNEIAVGVYGATLSVQHATIVDNGRGISGGGTGTAVTVVNSILSENDKQINVTTNAAPSNVTHSDIWPMPSPVPTSWALGEGVVSVDPEFVNVPSDLHLSESSACIDAGLLGVAPAVDVEGHARPLDGDQDGTALPDLGAYELLQRAICGDGETDFGEVCDDAEMNGAYGRCNEECSGPGRHCGDAVLDPEETCDDGGTESGDGCTADCGFEPPPSTGGMSSGGGSGECTGACAGAGGNGGEGGSPEEPGGFGGTSGTSGNGVSGATGVGGGSGMAAGGDGESVSGNTGSSGAGGGSSLGGGAGRDEDDSGGAGPDDGSKGGRSHTGGVAGKKGSSGSTGTAGTREADAGEAGARGSGCDPGKPSGCDCPDGSTGARACDAEGNAICYCETKPVVVENGCGCRSAGSKESPVSAWFGLICVGGLAWRRRSLAPVTLSPR